MATLPHKVKAEEGEVIGYVHLAARAPHRYYGIEQRPDNERNNNTLKPTTKECRYVAYDGYKQIARCHHKEWYSDTKQRVDARNPQRYEAAS